MLSLEPLRHCARPAATHCRVPSYQKLHMRLLYLASCLLRLCARTVASRNGSCLLNDCSLMVDATEMPWLDVPLSDTKDQMRLISCANPGTHVFPRALQWRM